MPIKAAPLSSTSPKSVSSNFQALHRLKQTENHLEAIKRRLSALRIQQDKNLRKSETTLRKIKLHQALQELEQKQREKRERSKLQRYSEVEKLREVNSVSRMERKQSLSKARQSTYLIKNMHYQHQKQLAIESSMKIQQSSQDELSHRQMNTSRVKQYEANSKINYGLFHLQRKNSILLNRQLQSSNLDDRKQATQLAIKELMKIEMDMVGRQSKSKDSLGDSRVQLSLITNPEKKDEQKIKRNSSHDRLLPVLLKK